MGLWIPLFMPLRLLAFVALVTGPWPQAPPPLPLSDLLTQAKAALEASDRSGARRVLEEARRQYPESPAVYNFLGALAAEDGNYEEAERRFREATSRAPRYTDARLNLARLYQEHASREAGTAQKGLAEYQAVLGYEPDQVEARYQSAVLLQSLGEFGRSLEELNRLPPADQERPAALAVRCADHTGRGERSEADQALDRLLDRLDLTALDVRPVLPTLAAHGREDLVLRLLEVLRARGLALAEDLGRLGLLHEAQGRLEPARRVLEEAAQAPPVTVPLLLDLARVAHKEKDYRGALGYLARARHLEPENARVHFFFGMVCVNLDLGAEAYDALLEAVRLEPDNPAFNYAMGAVALQRRDPAEAIPYFRKYTALRPDDFRGSFGVGIAAFKAHDFVTARAELVPAADRPETAASANYFLARMAREENDLEEALRLARKATLADPRYPEPHAELGLIYLRRKEVALSEEALRRCLELDPENYLGNLHLLMLYERTKDDRHAAQAQRFEELKARQERKADEFLRVIEVRPY
jgi:tetratricopeptide (TPR) repeat protein